MNPFLVEPDSLFSQSRRQFLAQSGAGLGGAALASLLGQRAQAASSLSDASFPTHAPKAKRVIYLFQSGGPSQMDLFDYKPHLNQVHGQETPESIFNGQRLTGMTAGQSSFPVARSIFDFKQHGQSGAWISELMPHLASVADDITFVKSLYTEAINHDPAITFLLTGFQIAGRPSVGAWSSYGLGSENENLPAFVAMLSGTGGQPLYDRLWGPGFLPSKHQGVRFRSGKDPVLFLNNPSGISDLVRRQTLDDMNALNRMRQQVVADPEIETRIAQYEMAHRMQTSVPELTDLSDEPESTFELYGEDARKPGTYAYNVLMARRLAERGTRYIQLFHRGWDQHNNLPGGIRRQCERTDQASAGLIKDLKLRGLLEDTLVIWGGEFGRTVYCQGDLSPQNYGRDHHPRCFTVWMAGGGIKPGVTLGETDDFSYNVTADPVSVHDFHATILHLLGVDHEKLTYKFQGRHFRLTDVHGHLVDQILA
ncbi:MAG: DUF1501 domain-containing protein [Verrucomicrobiota bacterium]